MHKETSTPKASEIAEELITSGGKIGLNILLPILGPIINEAFAVRSRLSHKKGEKHDEQVVKKLGKTLGPIINNAFDNHSHLSQKRKEKYLELVIKKLENVEEDLIDKEFIQTEDFIDLIQTIMSKISIRQTAEKTEFFANLSIASLLKTRTQEPIDWQIRFIDIIADLNEEEMSYLRALCDHKVISQSDLCFSSLISKGLVVDMAEQTSALMTPLAKKTMDFIIEVQKILKTSHILNPIS